jgi:hypothetical protein
MLIHEAALEVAKARGVEYSSDAASPSPTVEEAIERRAAKASSAVAHATQAIDRFAPPRLWNGSGFRKPLHSDYEARESMLSNCDAFRS